MGDGKCDNGGTMNDELIKAARNVINARKARGEASYNAFANALDDLEKHLPEEKPRACPFCGSDSIEIKEILLCDNIEHRSACKNCNAIGPISYSRKGAIDLHNGKRMDGVE